jgi:hypothetical protein
MSHDDARLLYAAEKEARAERDAYAEDELRTALARIDARAMHTNFRGRPKRPPVFDPADRLLASLGSYHGDQR